MRCKGEGSICQLPNKRWQAKIMVGIDEDGKLISKQFSGKTQTIVNEKLKTFIKERDLCLTSDIKKVFFNDYIKNWMYTYKYNELKPSSFDRLENIINSHIVPYFKRDMILAITTDKIQTLINNLVRRGLSYSTIKKVYDAINACYKHALVKRDVIYNPTAGVTLPAKSKFTEKQIVFFTPEETKTFFEQASKRFKNNNEVYRYCDVFLVMLNTGIRIGEMIALRWQDVDLNKKTINIKGNAVCVKIRDVNNITKHTGRHQINQITTKTMAGERIIGLNSTAYDAIVRLKEKNPMESPEFVVFNSKGKQPTASAISNEFKKILEKCHLKDCGLHTLRHTFASMLFARNVDIKTISTLLGHARVAITYDTYVHLMGDKTREAIELICC